MATVTFSGAQRWYPGAEVPAVPGLDLRVRDGEVLALVGPAGSGKSTVLRMLAGLEAVSDGSVHVGDRDVTSLPARERGVAVVFQNYALHPHLSVAENIGYALDPTIAAVSALKIAFLISVSLLWYFLFGKKSLQPLA